MKKASKYKASAPFSAPDRARLTKANALTNIFKIIHIHYIYSIATALADNPLKRSKKIKAS
jgi:hypothetical protein